MLHLPKCLTWFYTGPVLIRIWGFPSGSAGKESTCSVGDLGSIPGLGRSPGEGKGYPLQYSGLENPMDCIVHGVGESDMTEWVSLSIFLFTTPLHKTNTHPTHSQNGLHKKRILTKAFSLFLSSKLSTQLLLFWSLLTGFGPSVMEGW